MKFFQSPYIYIYKYIYIYITSSSIEILWEISSSIEILWEISSLIGILWEFKKLSQNKITKMLWDLYKILSKFWIRFHSDILYEILYVFILSHNPMSYNISIKILWDLTKFRIASYFKNGREIIDFSYQFEFDLMCGDRYSFQT